MSKAKKTASAAKSKKPTESQLKDLPPREKAAQVKGGMNKSELVQMLSNRAK